MRHTAIAALAETGADFQTIKAFSGHRTNEMAMRYIHARAERVNDALDASTNGEQIDAQMRRHS